MQDWRNTTCTLHIVTFDPLFLAAALVMPVAMMAAPAQHLNAPASAPSLRFRHKDYHNWDDNLNHTWGQYVPENNKKPHEFVKATKSEYRNWRHDHPDDRK